MRTPGYEVQTQAMAELQYGLNQNVTSLEAPQNEMCYTSLGYQNELLQNNLVKHKPCIDTLLTLEANLALLNKETCEQRLKICRLEESCKMKDNTIANLKQQRNLQDCRISTLTNNYIKKKIASNVSNSEKKLAQESEKIETPLKNEVDVAGDRFNNKLLCPRSSDEMRQELVRLRLENRDVIRLQAKVCKLELSQGELKHLKEQNSSQRQEIAQLERRLRAFEEDSGLSSISRDLTSVGESSSDYTAIADIDVKALSTQIEKSQKTLC